MLCIKDFTNFFLIVQYQKVMDSPTLRCGTMCPSGKKCKRQVDHPGEVCWQHSATGSSKKTTASKSPKKSVARKSRSVGATSPVKFDINYLETLPKDVLQMILLEMPKDQINAVCRSQAKNSESKIRRICQDSNFRTQYIKKHGEFYEFITDVKLKKTNRDSGGDAYRFVDQKGRILEIYIYIPPYNEYLQWHIYYKLPDDSLSFGLDIYSRNVYNLQIYVRDENDLRTRDALAFLGYGKVTDVEVIAKFISSIVHAVSKVHPTLFSKLRRKINRDSKVVWRKL